MGLLGWDTLDLVKESSLSRNTISNFKNGKTIPTDGNLKLLKMTFEGAGIEFGERDMVRWKEGR